MNIKHDERDQARDELRKIIKPGDTVYTILRHVSRSGMSRIIDCYIIVKNEPRWIGRLVADALDWTYTDKNRGGLRVGGCGMDMGYHVVSSLSYALHENYKCTGKNCGSNAHVNWRGKDNEIAPYKRDGKMQHKDGYALNHKWL